MPTPTLEEKKLAEEQEKKDNSRFQELRGKDGLTAEEKEELSGLKDRYNERAQRRFDKMTWETKSAKEELEKVRQEKEDLAKRLTDLEGKNKREDEPKLSEKDAVIKIGDEVYFSDKALIKRIKDGKINEDEAYQHQQARIEAAAADRAYRRIKAEQEKESVEDIRKKDAGKVLKEYPHFNKYLEDGKTINPDFDPHDPLYKKATELWEEVYHARPDGFSRSISRAKEILRISDKAVDRSEDLSMDSSGTPPKKDRQELITLSDSEKAIAVSMFCRDGKCTEEEACAKALEAKKSRINRRVR